MQLSEADRRRVAERYPPSPVPRWVVVVAVALVAAGGLGWLGWTATLHALPTVSGQVAAFTVVSDRRTDAQLTIDRRDPSVAVQCRVIVQAPNFETVGEASPTIAASPYRVVDVDLRITTLRRGTSASLDRCWVP